MAYGKESWEPSDTIGIQVETHTLFNSTYMYAFSTKCEDAFF